MEKVGAGRRKYIWGTVRCLKWVCAVIRRRFPVGANPTRQPLQPEAIGAVMEVTKWLKPSISVSRIGDSASVQAVTRVNCSATIKTGWLATIRAQIDETSHLRNPSTSVS